MSRVITYQSPHGGTVNLTIPQVRMFERAGWWPKDWDGSEYCTVHRGLHEGLPTWDDEEVRRMTARHQPFIAARRVGADLYDVIYSDAADGDRMCWADIEAVARRDGYVEIRVDQTQYRDAGEPERVTVRVEG